MQQANGHSNLTLKSGVILLVEDHDIYREVVRAALGKYLPHFEMVEADSVAAALPVLRLQKIDVLLIDMTLPDGSAIDLLERAAYFIHQQAIKVIVLSSHSTAEMLPVLSRPDVQGFVSKEQGLKALAEAVTEACRTSAPELPAAETQEPALEQAL
ncbi:response regulator [Prosthecobacter sp.]|uniref:response regulator n=1 Tax=Prosthecobacter sp. TaxID=1965333 RepID=UPI003784D838